MTRNRWPSCNAVRAVLIVGLGLATLGSRARAQCSDAGVCSVGGGGHETRAPLLILGAGIGSSDEGTFSYRNVDLGVAIPFGGTFEASASLPFRSTTGPNGSASGLGDLLLTVGASIFEGEDVRVRADAGVRFSTGAVDRSGLSQAYQPGLGTNDLLVGVAILGDSWHAGMGYQWSPGRSDNPIDRLHRGDDMSLRAGLQIPAAPWGLSAELIAIQRLQRSVVQRLVPDPLLFSRPADVEVADTDRLQINLLLRASVEISDGVSLNPQITMALLKRPTNLDGLTRAFRLVIEGSVRL